MARILRAQRYAHGHVPASAVLAIFAATDHSTLYPSGPGVEHPLPAKRKLLCKRKKGLRAPRKPDFTAPAAEQFGCSREQHEQHHGAECTAAGQHNVQSGVQLFATVARKAWVATAARRRGRVRIARAARAPIGRAMAMARASEPPRGIGKRRRWDEPIEQKAVASVAQRDALVGDERLAIAEEGGRVVVLLQVGPQLPHEPEDRPRPQGVDRAVAPLDRIDAKPLLVDILVWRRVELVTAKVVVRRVPIAARDVRLLCATLGRKIRARIRGRARRLRLGALPKLVDPRHQETANGRALPPAALRVLAHFVVRTKVLNLLGQIASVRRLHPAVLVRLTVLVFGSVEAGVLLIRAAGVVEGVDAILGEQNRLGRGVAHRLEKVSKRDATVHLCCPRVERLRRVARTVHLVIQRIDVRKRRHHEDVGHLLGCARRIVDQREQPLVHATRGLVAARGAPLRHLAGLWRRALVDPAPAEVVVPLVPCASVALGALAHVCSFGQLLQKAVPDAVELVAETPDEHRRVRSVLTHLPHIERERERVWERYFSGVVREGV
mmetsp:Transcript_31213/g.81440  ORF Transcript_31213/g.81440 Transcript_31213/m.81440 type:complete len:552 (-) Transcript_31213:218-1873(-)